VLLTATTQVTTPAPTRPSLEKEVGQLPYTPTLDVFKQAATPKYTTDVLTTPQTELEKQVGLTPYVPSPVAPIAQPTQTPLEQEAKLFETYTPPATVPQAPTFKDFVEANKQSVVVPTDRVETPTLPATFAETVKIAPTPTPTPVVEDKAPVQTVETSALPNDTRKRVMGETFTFDNYKNFLDSFQNASELSPEERAWLDGARQQIFSNYDFLTQEMARTQNVIMDRLNKGLDITDQENYYNTLTNEEMKFVKPMQASITPGMQAGQDLAQGAMGGVMQGIDEATGVDQTGSALDRYAQGIPKLQPGTPLETAQQRMADYQKAFMDAQQKQQQQQQPSMFRTAAEKQVQEDIARQNAQLDLQIKQAEQLRDFNTSEQLRAFQNALNEMNTQNFLNQQAQSQQFANRGLLQSGLLSDAMTRLGIGAQQQLRGLEEGRQANIAKASLDYQQTLDRINQTKADLESGRAKNVDQLTKQLIQDQQSADKYQADILKAQYEQRQGDAKQAFDYVKLIGDQTGYDVSGLLGYVANGDVQGIIQALKDTKNPALSLAGRQIQQELAQKEATSTAQILADQARAAQTWSEINGYISDPTGKAILKNGKVQPTYQAQEDARQAAAKKAAAATSSSTTSTTSTSKAQQKTMTLPQQLKFINDTVDPLLSQIMTPDQLNNFQKTGRVKIEKEQEANFNAIMKSLYDRGDFDETILRNAYRGYGLPVPSFLARVSDTPSQLPRNPAEQSLVNQVTQFMNPGQPLSSTIMNLTPNK